MKNFHCVFWHEEFSKRVFAYNYFLVFYNVMTTHFKCIICSCMAGNRTGDPYYNVAGKRDNHLSMLHILLSYTLFNQDVFTWSKFIPSVLVTLFNNLL